MRRLVTLAPQGVEPYATGVRGLSEAAHLAGWDFGVGGDERLAGDRPWQAKRRVVREAFEAGAERVFWSDADVIVRRPGLLAEILNQQGRPGLWSQMPLDLESYWAIQAVRNRGNLGLMARVRGLYRELCREFCASVEGVHFQDWLVGWVLPRERALPVLDVWDRIAGRLLTEGLTWSDGVSLGIAVASCGVPVRYCLRRRKVNRAISHLLYSNRTGRYAEKGTCLP